MSKPYGEADNRDIFYMWGKLGLQISGMPVSAAPDGYIFGGWYTKQDGHFNDEFIISADMAVYHKWVENTTTSVPHAAQWQGPCGSIHL